MRTGRCESFAEAAGGSASAARSSREVCEARSGSRSPRPARTRGAAGRTQRIIDTPHYRRNDEILRYVVWRNNTFGLHVHVGIRGADRAVAVCDALPLVPARAARAVGQLAVRRERRQRPPLGAHADLHAHVPALRRAGRVRGAGPSTSSTCASSTRRGSIAEHTQLWWSVRPHLAFPTVEIRICDGQPDARRGAGRSSALIYALAGADRARARRGRAAAGPSAPADRGEPLARDPLRALRRADRPRDGRGAAGAGARSRSWSSGSRPVAEELGAAPYLAVPAANAAERQIARFEEGATLREIYAEQVVTREAVHG